jgi:hypothetical protein
MASHWFLVSIGWLWEGDSPMMKSCAQKITACLLGLALVATPANMPLFAQIQTIDPNDAIDADLNYENGYAPSTALPASRAAQSAGADFADPTLNYDATAGFAGEDNTGNAAASVADAQYAAAAAAPAAPDQSATYQQDDLIGAAEGVFGKGAEGLAGVIQDILAKQGQPNGYIVGREAAGAFVVGLRYGSGKLFHKIEGERPVYWTGPSLGFDFGGNASSSFVLVYNLYDSEELFRRFPAGEGAAYFIGGFHVSYLRSGDKVLIPVRLGGGLRLGANIGYMKFSKKQKWMPF